MTMGRGSQAHLLRRGQDINERSNAYMFGLATRLMSILLSASVLYTPQTSNV